MSTIFYSRMNSPIGELLLAGDGTAITGLTMPNHKHAKTIQEKWCRDETLFTNMRAQLLAYFAGERQAFDLPLAPRGTDFQQTVWKALLEIPFGTTWSYGELARHIGKPKAARAVGLANGRNPISIIVPCHRVIGADGSLTGYGGGIARKRWLLAHEGHNFSEPATQFDLAL